MFARLGIDADLANCIQFEAQAGGKMPNAGLEETILPADVGPKHEQRATLVHLPFNRRGCGGDTARKGVLFMGATAKTGLSMKPLVFSAWRPDHLHQDTNTDNKTTPFPGESNNASHSP